MNYLHLETKPKIQKKLNAASFFLAYLLVFLINLLYFCFMAVDLTVSLAFDNAVSMIFMIAVNLLK